MTPDAMQWIPAAPKYDPQQFLEELEELVLSGEISELEAVTMHLDYLS